MNRISESTSSGVNFYKFDNYVSKKELEKSILRYRELSQQIIQSKDSNISIDIKNEMKNLLKILELHTQEFGEKKNILKNSNSKDKKLGNGTDSVVYPLGKSYVYKEGKEYGEEGAEYLRKKYEILKNFLGDIIPKSYFIYGESIENLPDRGLRKFKCIKRKSITIQRMINGNDCKKMSEKERKSKEFLEKLEKAHKKYVLLKMFLFGIMNDMGLGRKTFELQLDLGKISNMDGLHVDDINFIDTNITSPNIMWDGKKVSFIDFGSGHWNNEKEKVYQKMMTKEVLDRWNSICSSMNL